MSQQTGSYCCLAAPGQPPPAGRLQLVGEFDPAVCTPALDVDELAAWLGSPRCLSVACCHDCIVSGGGPAGQLQTSSSYSHSRAAEQVGLAAGGGGGQEPLLGQRQAEAAPASGWQLQGQSHLGLVGQQQQQQQQAQQQPAQAPAGPALCASPPPPSQSADWKQQQLLQRYWHLKQREAGAAGAEGPGSVPAAVLQEVQHTARGAPCSPSRKRARQQPSHPTQVPPVELYLPGGLLSSADSSSVCTSQLASALSARSQAELSSAAHAATVAAAGQAKRARVGDEEIPSGAPVSGPLGTGDPQAQARALRMLQLENAALRQWVVRLTTTLHTWAAQGHVNAVQIQEFLASS